MDRTGNTSFVQYVWFSFVAARRASGPRPCGVPGRGLRPTSGHRASARGRAAHSPRARPGSAAG